MIIISAMSENGVIGSGDGMPWDVPKEYEQYLQFVSGHVVVMGRKSYEIFGPDLPNGTKPIVLTKSTSINGAEVATSLLKALELADPLGRTVFVAGGASVYEEAIPLAEEMFLSTIKGEFVGDTYFPTFDASDWDIIEERNDPDFIFRKLRRR